jgi:hypothetical protein
MKAVRTSETSVDNHFTRQYIAEDNSEHHTRRRELEISQGTYWTQVRLDTAERDFWILHSLKTVSCHEVWNLFLPRNHEVSLQLHSFIVSQTLKQKATKKCWRGGGSISQEICTFKILTAIKIPGCYREEGNGTLSSRGRKMYLIFIPISQAACVH